MTASRPRGRLLVVPDVRDRRRGLIQTGAGLVPCALGRNGVTSGKREGDGATPGGAFRLLAVLYRPDRGPRPATHLPVGVIGPSSGWCDDPADRRYNRPVRLPYPGRHERLWRDDRLYDYLIVLDYNMRPPRPGAGSAIFLHIAREDFAPTEGCIAVARDALRRLLTLIGPATTIAVGR